MATVMAEDLEVEVETTNHEPTEFYEVVNDQIVEITPLSARGSWIANRLVRQLIKFDVQDSLGTVLGETLFILEHSPRLRRQPDVAFVSKERWAVDRVAPDEAAWDVIPDLAVEVVSPSDIADNLMDKIGEYFRVGVRLVWVVYPRQQTIYVYESTKVTRILGVEDELDGGVVIPGFRLPLTALFELKKDEPTPAA